jgi:hypothetical protein
VSRLKQQGVPADEAVKRVDLSRHKEHFPTTTNLGVPIIGVQRIYALIDARR